MDKVILNIHSVDDIILASRAAKFLLEHPDRIDALLEYGDYPHNKVYYVKQNKKSISVWEQ